MDNTFTLGFGRRDTFFDTLASILAADIYKTNHPVAPAVDTADANDSKVALSTNDTN